jgi:hypothetical protein
VRPKSHPDRFEDLVLSRHFTDNWALRVGNQPSRPFIRHILKNAIRVQTGRMLRTGAGEPFSTLSIFWYPPLGVILTLDKFTQTAVSVLSADMNKPS